MSLPKCPFCGGETGIRGPASQVWLQCVEYEKPDKQNSDPCGFIGPIRKTEADAIAAVADLNARLVDTKTLRAAEVAYIAACEADDRAENRTVIETERHASWYNLITARATLEAARKEVGTDGKV